MHISTWHGRRKNPGWSDYGVIQLRNEVRGSPKCKVYNIHTIICRTILNTIIICKYFVEYDRKKTVVLGVRKLKLVALYENIWRLIWREIILLPGPKLRVDSATARVKNMQRHFFWNIGGTRSGISIKIWKETRLTRLFQSKKLLKINLKLYNFLIKL